MNRLITFFLAASLLALFSNASSAVEIALIGDPSKRQVIHSLSKELGLTLRGSKPIVRGSSADGSMTFTVAADSDVTFLIADQLLSADLAFLVVDSTQGPVPIVREQLIIARQARVPRIVIYFSNTSALRFSAPKDAAELLELEEMEMRELLKVYEMGGNATSVLFDSDVRSLRTSRYGAGISEVRSFISTAREKRPPRPTLMSTTEFDGAYYLLSNREANGRGISLSNQSVIDVWIEGQFTQASVRSQREFRPADNGEFILKLKSPLRATPGSRVLLVQGSATVGVGVVKSLLQ